MTTINEIFRTFGPEYLQRYQDSMPRQHKKVIAAITQCRTETNGSAIYRCEKCGQTHVVFCGCGNRHCPQCQHRKTRQWLERQIDRQLPTPHFLITFTVPQQLRPFIRSHQRFAYSALFAASSAAMKKLAPDPKFIGGDLPGFFGVLHTWGRQLQYHPHIHYVVPGGAISTQDQSWHSSSPTFYLPVRALSKIFRGKFRDRLEKADLLHHIPGEVWNIDWNVNSQAVSNSHGALKYLAPYVFRVAISNSRIVKVEDRKVYFRYKKQGSCRPRTMALDALEFIRRFLQHVLPSDFMKVRYYGFLSPTSKIPLEEVRTAIETVHGFAIAVPKLEALPPVTCSHCGGALSYRFSIRPPRRHILEAGPSG
jgi:hypothetical protein